jgi:hypothetical protein
MLGTVVGGLGSFVSPDGDRSDYLDCVTVKWDSYSVKAPVKESNLILANSVRNAKFKVGDKVVYRKFGGSPQIVKEVFIAPKDIKKIADVFGRYWDEDKEKEILSKPGEWLAFGPFDVQEGKLYEKSVGEWITPATDQNALSKINGYYGRKEKIEGLTATVIPKVLETSGGAMVSVLLRVSDNDMLTAKQNSSLVSRCKAIAQEIEKIIVGLGYKKTSATNISFQGANSPYIQLYFKGKTIANSVRSTNSVVAKALNSNPEYSVGGEFGWAEGKMRLANSRIFNSVRGNTKLKNIDYWFADNGYGDDTLNKYVQSYKKNKCIDFVDRHADTAARDAFYDAMYELTGVKNRWALNSRAINSTNSVVAKALNAVAVNVKSYPFYVVDKAMKGKCIFSGRYELSDANDDVAQLKKSGVESKAVPRRVLIMSYGIDPDEESSWKKNHKKD